MLKWNACALAAPKFERCELASFWSFSTEVVTTFTDAFFGAVALLDNFSSQAGHGTGTGPVTDASIGQNSQLAVFHLSTFPTCIEANHSSCAPKQEINKTEISDHVVSAW